MIPHPPESDADVPGFVAALGLPGLVDVHVVYPHRPGMARWLTGWVLAFAATSAPPSRTAPGW